VIKTGSHYQSLGDDQVDRNRYEQAIAEGSDVLEAAAWSRTVDGVGEPVFFRTCSAADWRFDALCFWEKVSWPRQR
jgi:hypothetical protein